MIKIPFLNKVEHKPHTRAIVLFSAFIIFAILAAIFVFYYKQATERWVKEYSSKIAVCGNIINEYECFNKINCEGIYGPSCPDCGDLKFVRCQQIPAKVLLQNEQKKRDCEKEGGKWYRNKNGFFCLYYELGQPTNQ